MDISDQLLVNNSVEIDLEEIYIINLNILNNEDHNNQYALPKHHQCCAYTINLIATVVCKNEFHNK